MKMENKVLVELLSAGSSKVYDVYIPSDAYLYEVLPLLSSVVSDLSSGSYKTDEAVVLCNADTGDIYNVNKMIDELGIINGSRLMIV